MFPRRVTRSVTRAAADSKPPPTTRPPRTLPPSLPPHPHPHPHPHRRPLQFQPPPSTTRHLSARAPEESFTRSPPQSGNLLVAARVGKPQNRTWSRVKLQQAKFPPDHPPPLLHHASAPARMLPRHPHLPMTLLLKRPQPPLLLRASVPRRNRPLLSLAAARIKPRLRPPFPLSSPCPRQRRYSSILLPSSRRPSRTTMR
ncbi:hypothetical protein OH76DRAFT_932273 [Lentinus brumalis]|uniref:Uncharacterized protein n=1 Tax=Lentinus brumalis TaxID=2498619 RepID=A0A371CZR1_9APHY|nr:hypothetical protein OH76DRAFT_932273 [Polyporus brumalis]